MAPLLLALVFWQWGSAAWILVKAQAAQWLITSAWAETLALPQAQVKPWPWADTWPVARLQVPAQNIDLYVLAGAQGNALAFGPGLHQETDLPGEGISVIGGHRDTHFRFLQKTLVGDELRAQGASGQVFRYRVTRLEVVDINQQPLVINEEDRGLVLVTCFPFDALTSNGPLRLLVWAETMEPTPAIYALNQ